jgi:hypothetical protein
MATDQLMVSGLGSDDGGMVMRHSGGDDGDGAMHGADGDDKAMITGEAGDGAR